MSEKQDFYINPIQYLEEELHWCRLLIGNYFYSSKKLETLHLNDLFISETEIENYLKSKGIKPDDSNEDILLKNALEFRKAINKKIELSLEKTINFPVLDLCKIFGLNKTEYKILLLCIAPELDYTIGRIFSKFINAPNNKNPNINLIINLLTGEFDSEFRFKYFPYFHLEMPLSKYQLIELEQEEKLFLDRKYSVDNRILNFILGNNLPSEELAGNFEVLELNKKDFGIHQNTKIFDSLKKLIESEILISDKFDSENFFFLTGSKGVGKLSTVSAVCEILEIPLSYFNFESLLVSKIEFGKLLELTFRECALRNCAIYLDRFEILLNENLKDSLLKTFVSKIKKYNVFVFIGSTERVPFQLKDKSFCFNFENPNFEERKGIWKNSFKEFDIPKLSENELNKLSNVFEFSPNQIRNTLKETLKANKIANNGKTLSLQEITKNAFGESKSELHTLSQKISSNFNLKDIVLPKDQLEQLNEIKDCMDLRYKVLEDWGFGKKLSIGKGITVLFSGTSGTGKTMSAGIIGNELGLEVYKIDLSQIVSKYIGETEKNLSKVFGEAELSNAILFFDEADALFGKRTEVKDAHDRYANIEVGYLLQKMEEYKGMSILATNLKNNMDDAFTRRLQFIVDFPFPEEEQRKEIWRKIFPKEVPVGELDFDFLAEKLELSGGNIKNVALMSTYYAANKNRKVEMQDLLLATKREYDKIGKGFYPSDFKPYFIPSKET